LATNCLAWKQTKLSELKFRVINTFLHEITDIFFANFICEMPYCGIFRNVGHFWHRLLIRNSCTEGGMTSYGIFLPNNYLKLRLLDSVKWARTKNKIVPVRVETEISLFTFLRKSNSHFCKYRIGCENLRKWTNVDFFLNFITKKGKPCQSHVNKGTIKKIFGWNEILADLHKFFSVLCTFSRTGTNACCLI